jgi:hypothetical protein
MPLWRIYHATGTLSPPDQAQLARLITDLYSNAPATLPAFYVDVIYIEVPANKFFVAGHPRNDFVRFSIEHPAVHLNNEPTHMTRFHEAIDNVLVHFLKERGLEWEYSVVNGIREEWKFNGLTPPPFLSDAERLWAKEGRPVPY